MHLFLAILLSLPAVLMYHQVDSHLPPNRLGRSLTISPEQLREELAYLAARRLRAVSADDYLRAAREGQPTSDMVILTFDDGYEDQYTEAFPILLSFGAHATFFITTGNVGRRNHLTWPQIRTMQRSGMSMGGHNVHHVDLAALTPKAQRAEISGCLDALRLHAGIEADTYAYPGGTFDRGTEEVLEREPVELAFTTDPSHELGIDARLEISRVRVLPIMPMAMFAGDVTAKRVARLRVPHE